MVNGRILRGRYVWKVNRENVYKYRRRYMDNKGVPYFKARLKTKKLMVEVMEINYERKTVGYAED